MGQIGLQVLKPFTSLLVPWTNKLECLLEVKFYWIINLAYCMTDT